MEYEADDPTPRFCGVRIPKDHPTDFLGSANDPSKWSNRFVRTRASSCTVPTLKIIQLCRSLYKHASGLLQEFRLYNDR
jgi:hypothetical protein